MTVPIYIITGFLDSGKTTFLNKLLNHTSWKKQNILVVQFESGDVSLSKNKINFHKLIFQRTILEDCPHLITKQIQDYLQTYEPDSIWIEWNGMVPFSNLHGLLLDASLRKLCKIEKVIHLANAKTIHGLLGNTGAALPEQISNCDISILRNVKSAKEFRQTGRLLKGINPTIDIYENDSSKEFYQELFKEKLSAASDFLQLSAALIVFCLISRLFLSMYHIDVNLLINIFIGIILQAIPFLLIGVLISSFIQVFIPTSTIERWFPKSIGLGMVAAIFFGFCLPVCDCTSIPIFKGLTKKGIPLPVAITFMTVAPIINPVVILSTYYAFGGDITYVCMRICFGIISSVLIGLSFSIFPLKSPAFSDERYDKVMCSCGAFDGSESSSSFGNKLHFLLRHSQADFYQVGKYLIMGALISSLFQTFGTDFVTSAQTDSGLAVSIGVMMLMAFTLSLCSTSDAVVAHSLAGQFPTGAIMGFLIFGPMIDIKNVLMLSSAFSKKFVGKLVISAFLLCFLTVFLFFNFGGMLP